MMWLKKIKNQPIIALFVVIAVIIGVATVTNAIDKIIGFSNKYFTVSNKMPVELKREAELLVNAINSTRNKFIGAITLNLDGGATTHKIGHYY